DPGRLRGRDGCGRARDPGNWRFSGSERRAGRRRRPSHPIRRRFELQDRGAAFTLAHPYPAVIDMPEVNFALPPNVGEKGQGLIKAFRFGLVMQGGSRMVLDLARPAKVERAFVLDSANDQPARLVLELATTDRDAFMRTIALNNRAPDRALRKYEPEAEGKTNSDKAGDPRPLIVIDPGHGGIDAGTRLA